MRLPRANRPRLAHDEGLKTRTPDIAHGRQFVMRNEDFYCEECRKFVPALAKSCRNHCPFCLTSKHVDCNPGDRQNSCGSLMDAVSYTVGGKKGVVLTFRCRRCGAESTNRAALDDPTPDDWERILAIPGRSIDHRV